MAKVEITNMVMVHNREARKVLVINRTGKWPGICFPGGHILPGESLKESAVREVKEETGLTVSDLVYCGVVHWHNDQTGDRYLEFNYKTETFEGELIRETPEGQVFWVDVDDLLNKKLQYPLSDNFDERFPMFFGETFYSEAFAVWNDRGNGRLRLDF